MKYPHIIPLLLIVGQLMCTNARAAQIPSPIDTAMPIVSEELATAPGEVELQLTLNEHGYVIDASVKRSTNPKLEAPCLAAIRQWRYMVPAGSGISFIQPFRFGGEMMDTASLGATRPEPKNKVAPELPDALSDICGDVTIALAIGANGEPFNATVAKSSHEELNAACLAAAKRWTFKPATVQGRPIASNVYLPFHFEGSPMSVFTTYSKAEVVDNESLVPVRQANPIIPSELAGINADASLALTVDSHGFVVNAVVESSTNTELAELARQAVLHWKFKPIVKNGRAITVKAMQPMKFGKGSVSIAKVDKIPSVRYSVKPNLPEELKGVSGFARAVFDVDAAGNVVDVTIADGSHEAFNDAVLEVAKEWTFNPALRDGVATQARVTVPFMFGPKLAAN